jgi:tripartite-type tricarboxylate transporter receptor subunit TctC
VCRIAARQTKNLNVNFIADIAPVASLYRNSPSVMVVNPLFPAQTIREFIAYARAHPGKINMAHSMRSPFDLLTRCHGHTGR